MFAKKVLIALSLPFIFSLTACGGDGGGGDADQNVVRNIFAVGDILETKEDTLGVAGNVCENDLPDTCDLPDNSDNKLLFALEKGEAMENGSFSFCADGSYTYTPSELFTGSESIDYNYSSESEYGVSTLNITVVEPGESISGTVNNSTGTTYALAAGEATENGTLVFCNNGDVEYAPVQDFFGVDSISYVAFLGVDSSSATLTIKVANDFETLDEYGWNLAWSHDFTAPGEFNLGLWDGDNISVAEEGLKINPNNGQKPSLTSLQTIGEERGRIEAKIKTAPGIDVLSAFKLVPVSDSYDGNNSLSIMLAEDGTMTAGAHYGLDRISGVIINETIQETASDEWHTYAIEWGEKKIRWYIDGTHVYTVDTLNLWAYNQSGNNPRGDQIIANTNIAFDQRSPASIDQRGPGPFDQPMQIVFDLAAESENLTAEMQVEYVKVWSCDPSVEPSVEECASKEKSKISRAASDRVETVGFEQTTIFKDGYFDPATDALISQFHPLKWHYWEDEFNLTISNNGNSKVKYPSLEDEHGLVIDFDNSSGAAILDVEIIISNEINPNFKRSNEENPNLKELFSAELNGYDISLNFDLFFESAETDIETINIKMQSGNSGDDSDNDLAIIEVPISLSELESDSWNSLSFNIPEDFTPSLEGSLEFDPNNITSLMALEVDGGIHLQLDNIYVGCINSEGCLQGPMTSQTPLAPKALPIPIEAEEGILTQSGVGIYDVTAPDEGGGSYIGDVNSGDFVSYSFTAPGIGPYTIDYRVASKGESDGFVMSLDGVPIHSVSIPDTGGWEEWETISTQPFELLAGVYTIQIDFVDDGQNLNWLKIQPPISIFTIQAEEYDVMKGIDTEEAIDEGGTDNIGWIDKGDFVEYTVFVPSTGDFLIEYRVAGLWDSQGFEVRFDDILLDAQALETPSGWQTWDTQSSVVSLTEGEKTMRLDFIDGPININWIRFTRLAPE
jgi:hypothetical protein